MFGRTVAISGSCGSVVLHLYPPRTPNVMASLAEPAPPPPCRRAATVVLTRKGGDAAQPPELPAWHTPSAISVCENRWPRAGITCGAPNADVDVLLASL